MDFRDKGVQTQLRNIETQTGRTLDALKTEVIGMAALKHGERRTKLQESYGLSFVHADTLLLWVENVAGADAGDPLDAIYTGSKADLRPIHDAVIGALADWGPYELAPKKGYVSLRLKKQFCMIGPAARSRVAIGINARGLSPTDRLRALPPGKLCPLEVNLTTPEEVDGELMGWIRTAWEQAR